MDETEGTIPATESIVATTETSSLIASNRVEGTKVYGRDGDKIGTVYVACNLIERGSVSSPVAI